LYANIDKRVDEMIVQGLVEEASALHALSHLKPLQTVGYTELFDYFEGKTNLASAISKIKQHSRNYAKRQLTWFRHQSNYTFVPPSCENIIQTLGH
jgi:tRNA dimethylallyltransferase